MAAAFLSHPQQLKPATICYQDPRPKPTAPAPFSGQPQNSYTHCLILHLHGIRHIKATSSPSQSKGQTHHSSPKLTPHGCIKQHFFLFFNSRQAGPAPVLGHSSTTATHGQPFSPYGSKFIKSRQYRQSLYELSTAPV
ncbi:hypothetical protein CFOL_v3_02396 [Cephalotus follicularis]|uniref:Uncharacterized protein n=1 Tax=Cephalotus follicularis TaxID=3775 RepID=A0A1Q3ATH0_CEPFO|nr:hypothetical protein CFOL_v3_02396 [Cephalotus follicularis]